MNRRFLSSVFLLLTFVILSLPYVSMTGNVINELSLGKSIVNLLALVFFIVSVFLFLARKSLDAIIIPLGDPVYKKRVKRAEKEYDEEVEADPKGKHAYFVISGEQGNVPLKDSERYMTYNELRKHGINPSQMMVEGSSHNSMENILNSLERIKKKGGKDVGIASYPWHLERFNYIIDEAKKEGIVDKNFKIHRLETSETVKESVYGILAYLLERYNLRHGFKGYSRDKNSFVEKAWEQLKDILNPHPKK
ncbi:MAG: YdcF family protein [Candidatus Pacearchaeota archaeon]